MCDDFGPDWEDWMIIGPLSEDIARDRKEQEDLVDELFEDPDDPLHMPDLD